MLDRIRYQQQFRQLQDRLVPGTGDVAAYSARDAATGQRIVTTADGTPSFTQYLSNSRPNSVLALARSGSIGLPGYASQKPH
jgi:hypothetical protein